MKCNHDWAIVGYFDNGFGVSTSCTVKWCNKCGSLKKNKIKKPLNFDKISCIFKQNYDSGFKSGFEEATIQLENKYSNSRIDLW